MKIFLIQKKRKKENRVSGKVASWGGRGNVRAAKTRKQRNLLHLHLEQALERSGDAEGRIRRDLSSR